MPEPIVYIDRSDIRENRFGDVEVAAEKLARFIERNNPHILSYRFFLDPDVGRMTVVAVHPDSDALEHHMRVGDPEFRKFAGLLELSSIEVYGEVSEAVREQLDAKAAMLGRGAVTVSRAHAGFSR